MNIAGVEFHNVTRAETIALMEQMISARKSHMICTPNADHVVRIRADAEFGRIIANADLVVPDGMAVIYASRILGTPLKQNVGGRLLLPAMAELSVYKGYRIFLLGGSNEQVARLAVEHLRKDYPGVNIVGTYTPPFMDEFIAEENERMLDAVHRAKPDVLFVCLGTPKQEKWIARNLVRLNVPVSIGIGAALDMISGRVYEPPRWVSNVGLEWLVRLLQEPKRLWRRYILGIPIFLWLVLQQRIKS